MAFGSGGNVTLNVDSLSNAIAVAVQQASSQTVPSHSSQVVTYNDHHPNTPISLRSSGDPVVITPGPSPVETSVRM